MTRLDGSGCPDPLDLEAFLDADPTCDMPAIGDHLAQCARCAAHVRALRRVDRAAQESAVASRRAPATLTRWLAAHARNDVARSRRVSRRLLLRSTAAAAGLAGAAALWSGGGRAHAMAPPLFADFSAHYARGGDLDFVASGPERVIDWVSARTSFASPALPTLRAVGVRGARLCRLFGRRVAAVHLGPAGAGPCLYFTAANGLAVDHGTPLPEPSDGTVLVSTQEAGGAFWRVDGLAFALVDHASAGEVATTAARIRAR